jgi:hypothetical protein
VDLPLPTRLWVDSGCGTSSLRALKKAVAHDAALDKCVLCPWYELD